MAVVRGRRFGRTQWIALGLARLIELGPPGLTLDAVCKAARRTRGSFYHHFLDHDAFVAAVVAAWRDQELDATAAFMAELPDPAETSRRPAALLERLAPTAELAMRRLACRHGVAVAALADVDRKRVACLAELAAARFGLEEAAAATIAEIAYTAHIGHLSVWPQAGSERRKRLVGAIEILAEAGAGRL